MQWNLLRSSVVVRPIFDFGLPLLPRISTECPRTVIGVRMYNVSESETNEIDRREGICASRLNKQIEIEWKLKKSTQSINQLAIARACSSASTCVWVQMQSAVNLTYFWLIEKPRNKYWQEPGDFTEWTCLDIKRNRNPESGQWKSALFSPVRAPNDVNWRR